MAEPDRLGDGSAEQPANQRGGSARQPSTQPAREKRSVLDRMGAQRARQGAVWGRRKYSGSSAEYLWNRLNAVDFISLGILFAATMLLCFVPFLIVGDALAGRSPCTRWPGMRA